MGYQSCQEFLYSVNQIYQIVWQYTPWKYGQFGHSLKKSGHFNEIFITGCTGSCHLTSSCSARDDNFIKITTFPFQCFPSLSMVLGYFIHIWVRSRRCSCLVTWFCYQMIAKPSNKTATPSWPDPYHILKFFQRIITKKIFTPSKVQSLWDGSRSEVYWGQPPAHSGVSYMWQKAGNVVNNIDTQSLLLPVWNYFQESQKYICIFYNFTTLTLCS